MKKSKILIFFIFFVLFSYFGPLLYGQEDTLGIRIEEPIIRGDINTPWTTTRTKTGLGTTAPYATFEVRGSYYNGIPNVASTQLASGNIELARSSYPYIDFNGWSLNRDYDARIILRNDNYLQIEGGSLNVGYYHSIGSCKFAVNGKSYFSNYVGIGTNNPALQLDIYGSSPRFRIGTSTKNIVMGFDGSNTYLESYGGTLLVNYYEQNKVIFTGEVEFISDIKVNSKIYATEVIVQTLPFPDYVFKPDYDLKSLEEVENFIRRNNHLPGIPSSEFVAKNGVSVGDLGVKLLMKIEELTLYVIGLKNENEELRSEIQELYMIQKK